MVKTHKRISTTRRGKGKVWNGIKNFFSRSKILSNVANLIPFAGPAISNTLSNVGLGKRGGRKLHSGRGFKSWMSKIINKGKDLHRKVKDGKYISNYTDKIGKVVGKIGEVTGNQTLNKIADTANKISAKSGELWYGKRRKHHKKTYKVHGVNWSNYKGGKKLTMNGLGYVTTGGGVNPQSRTLNFLNSKLNS